MRSSLRMLSTGLLLLLALVPSGAVALRTEGTRLGLNTLGTPLLTDSDGTGIQVRVALAEPGHLRLRVADFDGRTVRELFDRRRKAGTLTRTWRGLDQAGTRVPHGPYRLVAETAISEGAFDDGTVELAEAWVTVASRQVYPPGPDLITVAIDRGHGGSYDGAVGPDGTREADLNGLTVSDAAYLSLLLDVDGELATIDRALARAARSEGVTVIG